MLKSFRARLSLALKRVLLGCLAAAVLSTFAFIGHGFADRSYVAKISEAAAAAQAASYGAAVSADEAMSLRIEKVDAESLAASQAEFISNLQQTIDSDQKSVIDALT